VLDLKTSTSKTFLKMYKVESGNQHLEVKSAVDSKEWIPYYSIQLISGSATKSKT
jgi:hypothetical protein